MRERFNPELFAYDPARTYAWQPFQRVTATVITWNRLDMTKIFFDTLRRRAGMPFEVLAVDNASEDGTPEYLAELAATWPGFRLIQNKRNVGKNRAMLQIQKELTDGLAVMFDSDIELLSNYWLVHLQKAYHAARLRFGNTDVAFGLRPLNCEEYGFGFTYSQEVLPIPHEANDLPRTSYAAVSKDSPDKDHLLDEQVIVGWTGHLMGNNMNMPVSVLKRLRLDELYPVGIGADDTHVSAELRRLGVPFGYIQNGPIVRHNDWPYTDEKIEVYQRMMQTRMVTDLPYIRWKLNALVRKLRGR